MRLVLRILGTDIIEIHTGRDTEQAALLASPGAYSADVSLGPMPFGFLPHDEPLVEDD